MQPNKKTCKCQQQSKFVDKGFQLAKINLGAYLFLHILLLAIWYLLYSNLKIFSEFVTYTLLKIIPASKLGATVAFFFYDTTKIFLLLVLVVYFVGILRSFILSAKIKRFLSGKKGLLGHILAALLGVVTPFCSCSAVPLFIGFVTSGVPLGVTFSFLVSAPMINEVALILLYGLLGWKIAGIYLSTGLIIAVFAGIFLGKLHPEKYLENWAWELHSKTKNEETIKLSWYGRIIYGYKNALDTFCRIWIYVVVGVAIGAIIHGYVPESYLVFLMGSHSFWSVPVAVLMGIPLYSNAAGIIPIVEVLLGKGAAIGTVLAFMMSVTALSFPEMLMLRKVLKLRLIVFFIAIVSVGIIIVGYLFNWL